MLYPLSFVFGLLFGSFANVCIFRMPVEASIVFPPSHCVRCKKPLRWFHNIPLFSFFWLRGRCAYCEVRLSWQYPLVEFIMSLLFLFSAWRFQTNLIQVILVDVVSFYLLTISIIDFHHKIIPDELSVSLMVMGLLVAYVNPYLHEPGWLALAESLGTALLGGGFMLFLAWGGEKLFKKEAMGGGDVKLIAAFGAILGWRGAVGALMIGSAFGAVVGLALILLKRKKRHDTLPFGPFLCIGAYLVCLFPDLWTHLFSLDNL